MKNLQIKTILVCLFSLVIVSTVNCNIFSQGDRDAYPENNGISKDIVYVALNVGRVIGNMVFTMDDDRISNPAGHVKVIKPRSPKYIDAESIAIGFGVVALVFLIINFYFGGKIVQFLKSKGKKAHFWNLRWMIFSYINQYKKLTISEDGQVGPYYRPISISALLFIISLAFAVYFAALS